jgi:hypothetical protein
MNEMIEGKDDVTEKFLKGFIGEDKVKEGEEEFPAEEAEGGFPGAEEGKEYLGHKGDEILYYLDGEGEGLQVVDGEGNVVLTAKDAGASVEDRALAVVAIVQKLGSDIEEVSRDIVAKYYDPVFNAEEKEEKPAEEKEEKPAEEPTEAPAEEEVPTEGKEPTQTDDTGALVKTLLESGNYDILASGISDKAIAEDIAKVKNAHVIEDVDNAFDQGKGMFVVIREKVALKENDTVPPQKGDDPTKGAKMGETGQTENQPKVPDQKGDDPTKGAKPGATGPTETQPKVPDQKGVETTKGGETKSAKDAEKEPKETVTVEGKKK